MNSSKKSQIEKIKTLRRETGAPILEIRKALEESGGDIDKAKVVLKRWSSKKASSKKGKETKEGLIVSYIHQGGRIGALVKLTCETDFVARTDDFKKLAHELAMQVAAMKPEDAKTLLNQEYIRNPKRKIKEVVDEYIAKLGENIEIKDIVCFSIND
jgi:elongation factor Ts